MKRILFLLPLIFCLFRSVTAQSDGTDAEAFRISICDELTDYRSAHHATEPAIDACLTAAAQRQAEYMAELGKLTDSGPAGETIYDRAIDAGYGGDRRFEVREARAKVWVDTDADYLINSIWKKETLSVRALMMEGAQHIGIGIADAPDKHRYIVVMIGAIADGDPAYDAVPTYDFRTPKPENSATPTPAPLITSTMNPDGGIYHEVKAGETFSEIAMAYGLDWYTLSVLNHIKLVDGTPVVVYEGDTLVIQPTFTVTPTPTATKTPLPPTHTPRPTFTGIPATPTAQSSGQLPPPDITPLLQRFVTWFAGYRAAAAYALIGCSVLGLVCVLFRGKRK